MLAGRGVSFKNLEEVMNYNNRRLGIKKWNIEKYTKCPAVSLVAYLLTLNYADNDFTILMTEIINNIVQFFYGPIIMRYQMDVMLLTLTIFIQNCVSVKSILKLSRVYTLPSVLIEIS